jgi:dTDP-4-dehydrorhamnose 3,5-epimerase
MVTNQQSKFQIGPIDGVVCRQLQRFNDQRGWLVELFRADQLPFELQPVMAYISETLPGVARGPHEHVEQTDLFAFIGPGEFRIYLWDARPRSRTLGHRQSIVAGASSPQAVLIPPGVVHAYQNIGEVPGWVLNCPNRLYRGRHREKPVDEIRHEDDPASPYRLDAWTEE